LQCSYCGTPATEWDHLRPLVMNKKPTGYISEIHNLVPASPVFKLDASPLSVETRETYDKSRTLQQAVEIYAAAAQKINNGKKAAE